MFVEMLFPRRLGTETPPVIFLEHTMHSMLHRPVLPVTFKESLLSLLRCFLPRTLQEKAVAPSLSLGHAHLAGLQVEVASNHCSVASAKEVACICLGWEESE